MKYLDFQTFEATVSGDDRWRSYRERWLYHEAAIGMIKGLDIKRSKSVLEMGTFGAGLVIGSDRMDLPGGEWEFSGDRRTILHDARVIPWPITSGRYDLLVALRLWHHLAPLQRECFMEAKRIARNIIIECPEQEVVGVGIAREQFIEWNGEKPAEEIDFGAWGRLYLFKGSE